MMRFFLLLLLFPLVPLVFGQPADTQGWASAELDLKMTKKWAMEFKYQARLDENVSHLKGHYATYTLSYKVLPWLTLSPEYRIVKSEGLLSHRGALEVEGKWKHGKWEFSVAPKYMYETDPQADDITAVQELEPEIEVQYQFNKRNVVYVSNEVLWDIGNAFQRERIRAGVGYEHQWSKSFGTDFFFKAQWAEKKKGTELVHIAGIGLKYKINLPK